MSSILQSVGTKIGTEIRSLSARVSTLESGGGGGGGGGGETPTDSYSETTYSSGVLTRVTTWSTSSKDVLVQTKSLTYTDGRLTGIVITDINGTTTLTTTLTYDSEGNLGSITKDYA